MSSSLRRLSFLYSGVIFVPKELYVIALIILLCNTLNCFKVVMPTLVVKPSEVGKDRSLPECIVT